MWQPAACDAASAAAGNRVHACAACNISMLCYCVDYRAYFCEFSYPGCLTLHELHSMV